MSTTVQEDNNKGHDRRGREGKTRSGEDDFPSLPLDPLIMRIAPHDNTSNKSIRRVYSREGGREGVGGGKGSERKTVREPN
jgi:hypothetical protein